jgi:hypothetical protein
MYFKIWHQSASLCLLESNKVFTSLLLILQQTFIGQQLCSGPLIQRQSFSSSSSEFIARTMRMWPHEGATAECEEPSRASSWGCLYDREFESESTPGLYSSSKRQGDIKLNSIQRAFAEYLPCIRHCATMEDTRKMIIRTHTQTHTLKTWKH